ncbi:MAG: ATP synthase F0 subunit B [Pseudomonadota bacterium]
MRHAKLALLTGIFVALNVAATAWAASGGHGDAPSIWTTTLLVARVVNAILLIAALVYFVKKPLTSFFSDRKLQIQAELEDAKRKSEEAERLIKEYESKMISMGDELNRMRDELKKSAETESEKVVANADRMAASMIEAAKLAAEQEVRKAKAALRAEAVDLAVQMAEALIREQIDSEDQKRIVEDYLAKVGGMK